MTELEQRLHYVRGYLESMLATPVNSPAEMTRKILFVISVLNGSPDSSLLEEKTESPRQVLQ